MTARAAEARRSTRIMPLQMPRRPVRLQLGIEEWLEAERDTLILWLPVSFGGGIAAWFVLPDPASWTAMLLLCVATRWARHQIDASPAVVAVQG
ncbi:hypothetical protein, partial [Sphingomonas sp. RIT328]|uniref:hypothetical protein n=1 Tax=Sphingomonas sp. RIT328 TaxID=1470591 RepID=UPI001268576F